MGNTVPEKESIEHCRYIVMFPILSGFMGIRLPPQGRAQESIRGLPVPPSDVLPYAQYERSRVPALDGFAPWKPPKISPPSIQAEDIDALHYRCFASVGIRDSNSFQSLVAHRTDTPSSDNSPRNMHWSRGWPKNWPMHPASPRDHGQIEARAFFGYVGGREVNSDPPGGWKIQNRNF